MVCQRSVHSGIETLDTGGCPSKEPTRAAHITRYIREPIDAARRGHRKCSGIDGALGHYDDSRILESQRREPSPCRRRCKFAELTLGPHPTAQRQRASASKVHEGGSLLAPHPLRRSRCWQQGTRLGRARRLGDMVRGVVVLLGNKKGEMARGRPIAGPRAATLADGCIEIDKPIGDHRPFRWLQHRSLEGVSRSRC